MCKKCDELLAASENGDLQALTNAAKELLMEFQHVSAEVISVTGTHAETGETKQVGMVPAEALEEANRRLECLAEKVSDMLDEQVFMTRALDEQVEALAKLSTLITMSGNSELTKKLGVFYKEHKTKMIALKREYKQNYQEPKQEEVPAEIQAAFDQLMNSNAPQELKDLLNGLFKGNTPGSNTIH